MSDVAKAPQTHRGEADYLFWIDMSGMGFDLIRKDWGTGVLEECLCLLLKRI